jgi:NADPH:quinone reductase-like Zn-dependent oxidoreductase
MAKFRKINTILTVRNEKYISGLKELGANEIIDVSKESLQERVNEITNGKGVAAALDAVGGKTGTEVLKCIAPNGRLIAYGRLNNEPVSLSYELLMYRFVSLKGFSVRSFIRAQTTEERNEMIQSLVQIIGDENFKLKQASEYTLEDFKDAIKAMQSYGEKIILRPN